jgi:hypothetical protein
MIEPRRKEKPSHAEIGKVSDLYEPNRVRGRLRKHGKFFLNKNAMKVSTPLEIFRTS